MIKDNWHDFNRISWSTDGQFLVFTDVDSTQKSESY